MSRDADRNLLFGIIALQNDFITRDALIAAMNAWAIAKHRSIGEILVERGDLKADTRELLERMIEVRVANHGGDAGQSLAAMSPPVRIVDHLRAIADPDLQRSLGHVSDDGTTLLTRAPLADDPLPHPRYRKLRGHAEGGLGVVFVARDEELNREVALKEIKEVHADEPESQARFCFEAEVTGGLEHPGIVPVYGLGRHPDGRPFYAMRFIRGDSLKDAIARFHRDEKPGRDPGERALALQKLLRRFLDVCNAIAYAHSRGVLHRDLKPQNVMVGRFGETLVVDWGLAKTTDRSGAIDDASLPETALRPSTTSGASETQAGTVIGTPAYMSPEQAGGRLDLLGPASDVYSLGATLYSLLTGVAPFTDKDVSEVLRKVEAGEFPKPRSISAWLDPALEAICLQAMARKPDDRYVTPRALADDIERWLADEAVSAYTEPLARRTRRWARKHRTAVTTAGATLLVAVVALAVGLVVVGGLNRRLEKSNDDLAQSNKKLDNANVDLVQSNKKLDNANVDLAAALKSATEARGLAEARKKLADENFTFALDAVKAQVFDINDQLQNRAGTRDLREKLQKSATDRLKTLIERTTLRRTVDRTAMVAVANLGDIYLSVDLKPTLAGEQYQKAHDLALALAKADPSDSNAQRDLSISYDRLGDVALQTGDTTKALEWHKKDLEVSEKRAQAHPDDSQAQRDLSVSYIKLGDVALQTGDTPKALEYYKKSLDVREKRAKAHPNDSQAQRDLSISYNNLGNVARQIGDTTKALESYKIGLDVSEKLAQADPNDSRAQRDLSFSYNKLGDVALQTGDTAKALESYKKGLDVCEKRALADPNDSRAQRDLSISYERLGNAALQTGDTTKALESYKKCLDVREKRATADPNDSQAQRDLSVSYNKLGNMALQTGDTLKALECYKKDLDVSEKRAKADPNDSQTQRDLSVSYYNLGSVALRNGDTPQALESYKKSLEGFRKLAALDPSNVRARRDLETAVARHSLAAFLNGNQKPSDNAERLRLAGTEHNRRYYGASVRLYVEAVAADPKLAEDRKLQYLYNAARSAALAGCGQGFDVPKPDDATKAKLRGQALVWLKAELAAWKKVATDGDKASVAKVLAHWEQNTDLAGVRDNAALAKLPEAERTQWQALWAEVKALRTQLTAK